jgi:hypothetical protein
MRVIRASAASFIVVFALFPGRRRHVEGLLSRLHPGNYRVAACHHARAPYQQRPHGDLQLLPAAEQPDGADRELHHDWFLLSRTRHPGRAPLDPPAARVRSGESRRKAAAAGRKAVQWNRRWLLDLFAEAQLMSQPGFAAGGRGLGLSGQVRRAARAKITPSAVGRSGPYTRPSSAKAPSRRSTVLVSQAA